jgi:pimeloyl-ACP methyl ester carboxylesterase
MKSLALARVVLLSCLVIFPLLSCVERSFIVTPDQIHLYSELKNPSASKGVIVFLHGLASDHEEWNDWINFLHREDWATLTLDFRGHGWSDGSLGGKEISYEDLIQSQKPQLSIDVKTALDFAKKKYSNIWIVGASSGAVLAFKYAQTDPTIRGLILLSPVNIYKDSSASLSLLGNRPLLIVSSKDDAVSFAAAEKLRYFNPQAQSIAFENRGHAGGSFIEEKSLKKAVLVFLKESASSSRT